jgi:hypothetical protein
MNSSNPWTACQHRSSPFGAQVAYSDGANDADGELLVQPDLNRGALLQKAEEKVDWRQQNPATAATTSASHCVWLMVFEEETLWCGGCVCWRCLVATGVVVKSEPGNLAELGGCETERRR